ncbi:MAG: putative aminopeptidase [Ignavibacteria bacterium]|nr:putative aminopeptidase [Ignavibacteria bacterium]
MTIRIMKQVSATNRNKKQVGTFAALMLLMLCGAFNFLFSQEIVTVPNTESRISDYIKFLASDSLEGRFPGTPGIEKAANFIEQHFRNTGLIPFNSSYRQELPVRTGLKLTGKNAVSFEFLIEKLGIPKEQLKPSHKSWETGTDWQPINITDNGSVTGEVVFCGFGITAKDIKYDDYEGIDVKGKIVIVLTDSSENKPQKHFLAEYFDIITKVKNARDHGAAAVVLVKMQSDSANTFYATNFLGSEKQNGLIVIQANRTSIAKFFPRSEAMYILELEINKKKAHKNLLLPNTKMTISVELTDDIRKTCNIIGMVKGSDATLSDENIVVGAHYDHIGWGEVNTNYKGRQKMIHNGADDNASGVAGLMEMASRIKQNPLKRSVIFAAFTGEELGILGSNYYINNPPAPLDKTVFMLNFDMIGRMKDNTLNVFGTNSSVSFPAMMDSISVLDSVKIIKAMETIAPSDNASFYVKQIPVLFFFTGVHTDYHRPSDDWEKINSNGEAKVLRVAETTLRMIGNAPLKPLYQAPQPSETTTYQPPATPGGGSGAWFGIVPNFEGTPLGFKIAGTSPGSPAEKAGLKANDIITHFGDKEIKSLGELSAAIKEYKPGDVVKVIVLRGKEYSDKKTFEVKLERKSK